MHLELNRDSHIPLYSQIVTELRRKIANGSLTAGDRLPANRELAKALGVNRNTVMTAYAELTADGLLTSRVGSGTYVNRVPELPSQSKETQTPTTPMPWEAVLTSQSRNNWLQEMAGFAEQRDSLSLALALPPAEMFPLDDFRRCVDHVLKNEGRVLLQLGTTNGYAPLQDYIVSQMALSGVKVSTDEVMITNGCQQSLDLIRQILVEPGEEVALENPTYPGALSVFCTSGSKYMSIPMGNTGVDLNLLEDVLSQRRPKLIYVVPCFQNPTGLTMDSASRRRLVGLAARYRVPIVEDDIYRELRYDGSVIPPLKSLDDNGLVIHISSFSKVGFPGLRVGWIVAPRIVIEHLNRAKQRSDLHASLLSQAAILEFARRGMLTKHIKRVKKAYAARRDAMLEALEKYFPSEASWNRPEGGMSVWVRLPESLNSKQLLHQAAEIGVNFIPGDHFYASSPSRNMMRLSFTLCDLEKIDEAVKRVGGIIKSRLSRITAQRGTGSLDGGLALV